MRYWVHVNNEVRGPFEKEKLIGLPEFTMDSLVCPENQAEGSAMEWKSASAYPELAAPQAPSAEQVRRQAAQSPLAMTMRGTLIEDLNMEPPVSATPAAAVPEKPAVPAVSPAPVPATVPGPQSLERTLERMGAMLESMAADQSRLLERVGRVEEGLAGMKAMLLPPPPRK